MAFFKARPLRRARIGLWSGLRLIGSISTLLLLFGLGLQWLIPAQWLEWHAETRLSQLLGQPLELDAGELRLFPLPHLAAQRLRLGDANARLLNAQSVRLFLDPLGLLQGRPFQRVDMARGEIAWAALLQAPEVFERFGDAGFTHLQITRLTADDSAPPAALSVSALPGQRWLAQLTRAEQVLSIRAEKIGRRTALDVEAMAWTLAAPHPLAFSALRAQLQWTAGRLDIERLRACLGEGQWHWVGHLEYSQRWRMEGSMTLRQMPLETLLARAGVPLLSGQASGTLLLSGAAEHLAQLASALRLSGDLELLAGHWRGIDLKTPAERMSLGEFGDKDSAFERMRLELERDAAGWRVRIDSLEAPGLAAAGALRLGGDGSLRGRLKVSLTSADMRPLPIMLAGTLSAPRTRVDPAALLAAEASAVEPEDATRTALQNLSQWWSDQGDAASAPSQAPAAGASATPWILDYD
jgi:hypothetical protein